MYAFRILIFSLVLFSSSFALTFSLTTNVGADVSFNGGQTVTTVGGVARNVTLSGGITSQTNVTILAKSLSPRHNDTTFTTALRNHPAEYPAWRSGVSYQGGSKVSHNGRIWEAVWTNSDEPRSGQWLAWREIEEFAVKINLPAKALPLDTAFIPVFSYNDMRIKIVGDNGYTGTIELKARKLDTLLLPLGQTVAISGNAASQSVVPAKLTYQHGRHLLTLSRNDYRDAEVRLIGLNGRVISSNNLSGINKTSINVMNVASGVYVLNVRGANGANFTSRIAHNGGDLRLTALFGDGGGQTLSDSRIARTAELRTGGINFRLDVETEIFGDTTININAVGGLNNQRIIFMPPSRGFTRLFSKEQYERMFPNRYGFGRAVCANVTANADPECSRKNRNNITGHDATVDFLSYQSFLDAIDLMGEVEVDYEFGAWSGLFRMTWKNKRTGEVRIITHPMFDGTRIRVVIDYADYCNVGDLDTRKRELAASLAHMTQETSGFGTSGDVHFHWGLYWIEEVEFIGRPDARAYQSVDPLNYYNANPARSYHGRGVKQLTHPYNYGPFSEFIFGDKQILINNPEKVLESGALAFASAIWFWMTPQPPKPSSHNVMIGNITDADVGNKPDRRRSPFGWTISIINGGFECGGRNDHRANNRIQHYKRYMQILGTSGNTADFGCFDMN